MIKQKVTFKNSKNQKLVGNLVDCGKDYVVVHCHGYGPKTKGKDGDTAIALSRELTKKSISNFRFDFSGFGESEGEFIDVTVTGAIDDLKSAVKYLKNLGIKNIALSGSSFGGNIVLNYIIIDKDIKAIALKAPVLRWDLPEIETSSKKFKHDIKKYSVDFSNKIYCPILIVHGTDDKDVPLDDSQKLCSKIENCELMIIKGGNHRLSEEQNIWIPKVVKFFERDRK